MEIPPPLCLKQPLIRVPNKTLMGPGPSNCTQRVLEALSNPIVGPYHPECFQIIDEIKEGLQYVFQTRSEVTMCVTGAAHAAMEMSLCNLIEKGDVILVGISGVWAQRAAEMARRYGADVRLVESQPGYPLTMEQIELAFETHSPQIFFVTQGESSTGVLQSHIPEIGELCRKKGCLFIVDTVASLGGTEFRMDEWLVDVVFAGAQKVLGAPPGISPIAFSPRAMSRVRGRKTKVPVFYFDVTEVGHYWNCFGTPRIYHHTVAITLLYGMREALAQYCSHGLRTMIRRHLECSSRLQRSIEEMGLEMFVPNPSDRLPTVTTVKVPVGVDWRKVSEYAMKKYSVEISGGYGPTTDQAFRIGLLGENATIERVDLLINILREAIPVKPNANRKSKI